MGVGTFCIWGLAATVFPFPYHLSDRIFAQSFPLISLVVLIVGALAALTHLSKPQRSNFSVTNLEHSWLSREALLGILFGLIVLMITTRAWLMTEFMETDRLLIALGILMGLSLVYTISRLYMLRTVPVWNNSGTPLSFFMTSFILGLATIVAGIGFESSFSLSRFSHLSLAGFFGIFMLMITQLMVSIISHLMIWAKGNIGVGGGQLLCSGIWWLLLGRFGMAFLGLAILFIFRTQLITYPVWLLTMLFLIFTSEVLGRVLFYRQYKRLGY
jgi:anaerobic dimethyl sulfoxide reductase subunit C (anchor subunit)